MCNIAATLCMERGWCVRSFVFTIQKASITIYMCIYKLVYQSWLVQAQGQQFVFSYSHDPADSDVHTYTQCHTYVHAHVQVHTHTHTHTPSIASKFPVTICPPVLPEYLSKEYCEYWELNQSRHYQMMFN